MRPQRIFSVTQLPADTPEPIRQVFQAFAQSIDQLVTTINNLTLATDPTQIVNGGPAGNFGGCFINGVILSANTKTTFNHQLGRTPVLAFEVMTVLPPNQAPAKTAVVVCPIALISITGNQISLQATSANRQFTLVLL